jgi:hypothetical protein
MLAQIAGEDEKPDKKQRLKDTIKRNIAVENGPAKVDRMLRLGQIKSTVINYDALKPKKPGIPRVASQRLKTIGEMVILPSNAQQSR